MEAIAAVMSALLTEKWLLSAVLFSWAWLERQERQQDKIRLAEERKHLAEKISAVTDVLGVLKERIK